MAPKRIYTRRNLDPNPPKVVDHPERILRRSNNKVDKGILHLQKYLSLRAKDVKSIVDIILDKKFEQMLLTSKYNSYLSQVVFDTERLIFSESA